MFPCRICRLWLLTHQRCWGQFPALLQKLQLHRGETSLQSWRKQSADSRGSSNFAVFFPSQNFYHSFRRKQTNKRKKVNFILGICFSPCPLSLGRVGAASCWYTDFCFLSYSTTMEKKCEFSVGFGDSGAPSASTFDPVHAMSGIFVVFNEDEPHKRAARKPRLCKDIFTSYLCCKFPGWVCVHWAQ